MKSFEMRSLKAVGETMAKCRNTGKIKDLYTKAYAMFRHR